MMIEEYEDKKKAAKRERQLKSWKNSQRTWQFIMRCHQELYQICGSVIEPLEEQCAN